MALRRLGLPHRVVNLKNPRAVQRMSPTGRVPVLEGSGSRIADSVTILDSLLEHDPGGTLFPKDPAERARDRLWDLFATDSLYWIGVYLRWLVSDNRDRMFDAMAGSGFSLRKLLLRFALVPAMTRRARGQSVGARSEADVEASLERSLQMVGDGLEDGPFLGGRSVPGRGDLAVASLVAQVGWRGTLPRTLERVRAHPALVEHVRGTFEACGFETPDGFR
jgi:glutathione S-transferase